MPRAALPALSQRRAAPLGNSLMSGTRLSVFPGLALGTAEPPQRSPGLNSRCVCGVIPSSSSSLIPENKRSFLSRVWGSCQNPPGWFGKNCGDTVRGQLPVPFPWDSQPCPCVQGLRGTSEPELEELAQNLPGRFCSQAQSQPAQERKNPFPKTPLLKCCDPIASTPRAILPKHLLTLSVFETSSP